MVVHEVMLNTLKCPRDEGPEVQSSQECAMAFDDHEDIRRGDVNEIS
jgi:translation initiation factor IF-2